MRFPRSRSRLSMAPAYSSSGFRGAASSSHVLENSLGKRLPSEAERIERIHGRRTAFQAPEVQALHVFPRIDFWRQRACGHFVFPLLENVRPPCRLRTAFLRLAEILEFARKPGPYGVWIFRKTRTRPLRKTYSYATRSGTRKSALGFWAVPENVRPPPCPPASSGFPSRGSGLSSPGEPPCR